MGISASWIAVKGVAEADALVRLGLVEPDEDLDLESLAFQFVRPGGDWLVLMAPDDEELAAEPLAELSRAGEVLACVVDDELGYSAVQGYAGGRAAWSVIHNGGEEGLAHLEVTGDPPPAFHEIHARLSALQAEEDEDSDAAVGHIFALPAELAFAVCGYRAQEAAPAIFHMATEVPTRPAAVAGKRPEPPVQRPAPVVAPEPERPVTVAPPVQPPASPPIAQPRSFWNRLKEAMAVLFGR
jgi:hypothetical protein